MRNDNVLDNLMVYRRNNPNIAKDIDELHSYLWKLNQSTGKSILEVDGTDAIHDEYKHLHWLLVKCHEEGVF